MSGMNMAHWKIEHGAVARGATIEVNGQQIQDHIRSLHLSLDPREVSRLSVEMFGEGTIEGDGIVETIRYPGGDELRAYIVQWLEEQDPDEVAHAMNDLPLNIGPAEAVLEVLRKRAVSG